MSVSKLAELIHPSGYYNAKALKLKAFVHWLGENFNDDLDKLFASDIDHLREQLLSVHGVGEETADSIILYVGGKLIFVVDAYTRRILSRHGIVSEKATYEEIQNLFMNHLPHQQRLFNEYHALLVHLGKKGCKIRSECDRCPLKGVRR